MPTTQIDAALELSLDAMRLDASIRRKVIASLKVLERELLGLIAQGEMTQWKRSRVNQQLAEARKLIEESYSLIAVDVADDFKGLATVSASVTAKALSATAVLPAESVLLTIANNPVTLGATQQAWWAKQSGNLKFKYDQAVRQGIIAAESNGQIITRVRQVMDVSRRNAASLVQTSTQSVLNQSRMAVFEANEDVIKGYRAVSALDSHVCVLCAPLADKRWTTGGTPIGHKFPMPVYPIHFNDRCMLVAIVFDGAPQGMRASEDGEVKASTTLDSFLGRKGVAYQDGVLGKGRAKLWRDGKITLSDLTSGTNRPYTIKQLESKYL